MGPDIPYALYEDSTGRMTLEEFLALPDAEVLLYGWPGRLRRDRAGFHGRSSERAGRAGCRVGGPCRQRGVRRRLADRNKLPARNPVSVKPATSLENSYNSQNL